MKILIINGPNLNLLGTREPEIYGTRTFASYFEELRILFSSLELLYFQSNHEGAIIDKLQEYGFDVDGIVLNAGAFTHTSVAIHDSIKGIKVPVIEVHISNIHTREEFRRKSLIAPACKGAVVGLGLDSYRLAIDYFAHSHS